MINLFVRDYLVAKSASFKLKFLVYVLEYFPSVHENWAFAIEQHDMNLFSTKGICIPIIIVCLHTFFAEKVWDKLVQCFLFLSRTKNNKLDNAASIEWKTRKQPREWQKNTVLFQTKVMFKKDDLYTCYFFCSILWKIDKQQFCFVLKQCMSCWNRVCLYNDGFFITFESHANPLYNHTFPP